MKHLKKHLKKINKESMKKGITTLILIFFAMGMILQKETPKTEFQFVRNDNPGFIHNAAQQQRDYLFQDEGGQQTYQGQMPNEQKTQIPPTTNTNIDGIIKPNQAASDAASIMQTGLSYPGTLHSGTISSQTGTIRQTDTIINDIINTGGTNCITPWKEEVKDKDFVLAYEQRKDVSSMCNIEKRTCNNGKLGGSFTQGSCREDINYTYRETEVISYNQKIINEYIQPTSPVNAGATFNTEGKIHTTEKPADTRGTSNKPIITTSGISQSPLPSKANCTTPRGQDIEHGQFIKAYKAPRGFVDLACNVEIRACVNGNLKGTFMYSKCTFNNTTYTDYLKAGAPASNTGFILFQRIKSAFKRGR